MLQWEGLLLLLLVVVVVRGGGGGTIWETASYALGGATGAGAGGGWNKVGH